MARKRIKTFAAEWNVPLEDVMASCARLRLAHAHSDSSLLSQEEADRVKADLDEQAHRASLLRRETLVETSAGKVLEKRLTATVMRRRHTEPAAARPSSEEPFHFEVEQEAGEPFVASFVDQPSLAEPAVPTLLEPQAETASVFAASSSPAAQAVQAGAESAAAAHERFASAPAEAAPSRPAPTAPPLSHRAPEAPAPGRVGFRPEGRTISLTGSAHAAAPSLDDGQRGPKVLGKIDLRRPAPRPAAPSGRPIGPSARPSPPFRSGAAPTPVAPEAPPTPPDQQKPGARAIKKRRVVKKDVSDFTAEREMRGLRVPKKRRALPGKEQRKTAITTPKASKRVVRIAEGVTVGDLARNMGVKAGELIKKLMEMGVMSTLNQMLDPDTATLVANEFGYSVENVAFDVESAIEEGAEEEVGEPVVRPPVVTVMGHVDHGKTSLLDAIRKTNVTAGESGGITQHIGAYTVTAHDRQITFVDTPGHEAFTAMRARGAKVTDIVVLVVAADEGVMPQTIEAINHARAAKVPIIVAINKIDRPEANVDRVKQQLTEQGLIPEDYGGETIAVPVSARSGEGIERLLEMILLQADLMELRAVPDRLARGTVVESQLDRGRGPVATVLIQEGTLHQGDPFVCGVSFGRVRAMLDYRGERLTEAGPSTPIEIFGLSEVPEPGTSFSAMAEEAKARQVAEFRRSKQREGELAKTSRVSLEDLSQKMRAGEVRELQGNRQGRRAGLGRGAVGSAAPARDRRGQARHRAFLGRRDLRDRRDAG